MQKKIFHFLGQLHHRAVILTKQARQVLGESFAVNSQMFLALSGHVLYYPIDHGKTVHVIASVNEGEAWIEIFGSLMTRNTMT